jgi:hypothetical protein
MAYVRQLGKQLQETLQWKHLQHLQHAPYYLRRYQIP